MGFQDVSFLLTQCKNLYFVEVKFYGLIRLPQSRGGFSHSQVFGIILDF